MNWNTLALGRCSPRVAGIATLVRSSPTFFHEKASVCQGVDAAAHLLGGVWGEFLERSGRESECQASIRTLREPSHGSVQVGVHLEVPGTGAVARAEVSRIEGLPGHHRRVVLP